MNRQSLKGLVRLIGTNRLYASHVRERDGKHVLVCESCASAQPISGQIHLKEYEIFHPDTASGLGNINYFKRRVRISGELVLGLEITALHNSMTPLLSRKRPWDVTTRKAAESSCKRRPTRGSQCPRSSTPLSANKPEHEIVMPRSVFEFAARQRRVSAPVVHPR